MGTVALAEGWLGQAGLMSHRPAAVPAPRSSFAGFRFPPEVIMLAVRWYLRYGLSYRDVEELLAEAARPCRHAVGNRWHADETYVKVAGQWCYAYRGVDQFGQVVDVLVSPRREARRLGDSSSGPSAHQDHPG